jgi:hypothetical protein
MHSIFNAAHAMPSHGFMFPAKALELFKFVSASCANNSARTGI